MCISTAVQCRPFNCDDIGGTHVSREKPEKENFHMLNIICILRNFISNFWFFLSFCALKRKWCSADDTR